MSAAKLPASPMIAAPYATADRDPIRTTENGVTYVTRPLSSRRYAADRLTADDRAAILTAARMIGTECGRAYPADQWADRRRAAVQSAIACTTYDLRASELAWIDAVGRVTFDAAKLAAATF